MVILILASDTPLSKEDVDALNKLLKDTKIELASNLLTLEMVQQLLHEKGLKTLSKNLRAKLNKGEVAFVYHFITVLTGSRIFHSDQARPFKQEAGGPEIQ